MIPIAFRLEYDFRSSEDTMPMVVPGKTFLCMIGNNVFLSLHSTIKNLLSNTSPFFQPKPNTQGPSILRPKLWLFTGWFSFSVHEVSELWEIAVVLDSISWSPNNHGGSGRSHTIPMPKS